MSAPKAQAQAPPRPLMVDSNIVVAQTNFFIANALKQQLALIVGTNALASSNYVYNLFSLYPRNLTGLTLTNALTNFGGFYVGEVITNGNYTIGSSNSVIVEVASTNATLNLPYIASSGMIGQFLEIINDGAGNLTLNAGITNAIGPSATNATNAVMTPGNAWMLLSLAGGTNWMVLTSSMTALSNSLQTLIHSVGTNDTNYATSIGTAATNYINSITNGIAGTNGLATTDYVNSQVSSSTNSQGTVVFGTGIVTNSSQALANWWVWNYSMGTETSSAWYPGHLEIGWPNTNTAPSGRSSVLLRQACGSPKISRVRA